MDEHYLVQAFFYYRLRGFLSISSYNLLRHAGFTLTDGSFVMSQKCASVQIRESPNRSFKIHRATFAEQSSRTSIASLAIPSAFSQRFTAISTSDNELEEIPVENNML